MKIRHQAPSGFLFVPSLLTHQKAIYGLDQNGITTFVNARAAEPLAHPNLLDTGSSTSSTLATLRSKKTRPKLLTSRVTF